MAVTAYFMNLANGQSIFQPHDAEAKAFGMLPPGGGNAATIQAVSKQIDDGELTDCPDSLSNGGREATVNVNLSGFQPDTWHMLTFYFWDSLSVNATTISASFRVFAPTPIPPMPPMPPTPPPSFPPTGP